MKQPWIQGVSFEEVKYCTKLMVTSALPLTIAPRQVIRGHQAIPQGGPALAKLGQRPLIVAGDHSLAMAQPCLWPVLAQHSLEFSHANYGGECSEASLARLREAVTHHQADVIIGVGGGKCLDAAKLLAHQCRHPIVTIPTTGATCAAWTALSNIYGNQGEFLYDVGLEQCPDLLILDYDLIETAPARTLIAGIGDALAKWYEASVSSGHSEQTLIIAAVQQARVLRDLLLQKSALALQTPGTETWREVVDATVLLAGVIGGLGGAQCRTVAAHAVHNGLTHIRGDYPTLHGEKVAFGILVQLRLEEMIPGHQLAASARQQLLKFYSEIGLPQTLADLGLGQITLAALRQAAEISCHPDSDLHHLPFPVVPEQLMAAMISTTAPIESNRSPDPAL